MKIIILGSAAGGGFPQWNCNNPLCQQARDPNKPEILSRTQSSIAVSANGKDFLLCNASPDLRQQINQTPSLFPQNALRDSPIRAVALTNGDVDHTAGLLTLRESQAFKLYATTRLLKILDDNPIFGVLNPHYVSHHRFKLESEIELTDQAVNSIGLSITAFTVPGKVALYLENESADKNFGTISEDTIGLKITDLSSKKSFFYIPGCARLDSALQHRLQHAELVLFDGTLFHNNEMIDLGIGDKTGARMGHINISGEKGSIEGFRKLDVKRKIYIHINNTNPILDPNSEQRKTVEKSGWEVSHDGMEIIL